MIRQKKWDIESKTRVDFTDEFLSYLEENIDIVIYFLTNENNLNS